MSGRLLEREEVLGDPLKYHGLADGIVTATSRHGEKITMLTVITPQGEWNVVVREVNKVSRGSLVTEADAEKAYARKLIDAMRTHGRMINHHLAKITG